MTIHIRVPSLGESVTEADLARWLVKPGDAVQRDQELCEIESDKTNLLLPSPEAGIISQLLVQAGERVRIGEPVAVLTPQGSSSPDPRSGTALEARAAHTTPPAPVSAPPHLSPAVRRLVEEHALSPSTITATGPGGRILKGDVLAHVAHPPAPQAGSALIPGTALPEGAGSEAHSLPASTVRQTVRPTLRPDEDRLERVRMSRLRRTVAERLVHAQHTAAMLTTFNEVDMSAIADLRRRYGETFLKKHGVKLGFMSFFVKACIEALKAFPGVNAELEGEDILYKHYYDIGVAVGGGRGLVVPVVRNADHLSFSELEKTIAQLGTRARDNKLQPDELTGGTFTLSNGGIYGSMMSTPILNWPQTGILGMHNIVERPVAVEGQVVIRPMMYLALSYDHRVIDGREAVGFLVRVKECVEHPERILLET